MILLQLSSGQGSLECCKAVGMAIKTIEKQCREQGIKFDIVEQVATERKDCFRSALLQLDDDAKTIVQPWQGITLWVWQSKIRPRHKRKNWFISGRVFEFNQVDMDKQIKFQACRAAGAGGQHVNTTDSAVRATHVASGISVRVETERSQHANKRLATALIFQKLEQQKLEQMTEQEKARWKQHWELERGNPVQTFKGDKFILA